ncbi:MAG: outer membrane protein transport protein [Verrucomicrobiota bacterium]
MNKQSAVKYLAATFAATPAILLANGMRLVSQDSFASSRGEAFAATADNPSAIYYNPAGITQLEGTQIRAGIYALYFDPAFTPPDTAPNAGNTYHTDNKYGAAPQLFLTHAFEKTPVTFGLGVYAPYGAGLTWPDDTGFRTVGTKSELTYLRFNPVIALKIAPGLSIGGGVTADYGKINLEQGLRPFYQQPNVNFFRFTGDGWSVGYNLGLLWQPHEKVSLGATFRSTTRFTMEGHTEFQQTPGPIQYTRLPAQADFKFPLTAVIGLSYRPTPKWNIEIDADYTDWSSFGTTIIYQAGTVPNGVKQNPALTMDWQPSWNYEFGVTRYFDNGWHISGGYLFNQNSVPDANYTPLVADLDRHFISLGAGRKGKRFDFDIAYQFGYGPAHTVTGSTPSTAGLFAGQNADGTYDFISHAVLVTVGMHF